MADGAKSGATEEHDRDGKTGRFKPGNSGCGGGRPKGSRNRLGEAFIADLQAAWQARGAEVIERVIEDRPQDFLKTVAGILPQKMEITRPEQDMDDAELADALGKLDNLLAIARRAGGGTSPTHGGAGQA